MGDELQQLQAQRDRLEQRLAVLEHALNEQKDRGGAALESVYLTQTLLDELRVVNDSLAELPGPTAS